jgi:hypothetical protein
MKRSIDWARRGRRGRRIVLVVFALVALTAPVFVLGTSASVQDRLADCGRGVPLEKCNETLNSKPGLDTDAAIAAVLDAKAPKPVSDVVQCGPKFFDTVTGAALTEQFGLVWCVRPIGITGWVVVGQGMSLTAADFEPSPGGAIAAVLDCDSADSACLNPDASHDFADFTVSYPPRPMSGRSNLQSIENGRFVMIANGYCGLFAFDPETLAWLPPSSDVLADVVAGGAPASAYKVPPTTDGLTALSAAAPTETGDCQPMIGGN